MATVPICEMAGISVTAMCDLMSFRCAGGYRLSSGLFAGRGARDTISEPEGTMGSNTGRDDPCGCGSGKQYEDCCGALKGEVESMRVKEVKVFE